MKKLQLRAFLALSFAALASCSGGAFAQQAGTDLTVVSESADTRLQWVTLGTQGGPVASTTRSQPANLLQFGKLNVLVDAGDGTAGQLAKIGLNPADIDAVFISHLHFDHMAGLLGILGLRLQTNTVGKLQIYGPPGTAETVRGIIQAMVPGATAGYGVAGAPYVDPAGLVEVTELRNASSLKLGQIEVSVRNNTHYSFAPESGLANRFESLSFRFDAPKRSIVYTGDTGPSEAVVELAQGADLLVAEMMDVDYTIGLVKASGQQIPPMALRIMESHFRNHHLTATDVGEMAQAAKVNAVVVTHFVGRERNDPGHFDYLARIRAAYGGPVTIATDLDRF
ncbi:MBL fold metallo-hydrolase [Altererythrobacter salegens]|uniref:MBL fold metallo-hydrolase n=1 Tax=Croceibacterium salegens TaxID=1737568 RepID=A0A6I4T1I7_9SPHN|nr:MBL fold metallo-hydrolase [Croceibacterium salegens]MXO61338.1 MBL fold metallo-hydrolase [Croceibacterium salegens]